MKTQHIAIVQSDMQGPAYGIGTTEAEARAAARRWGFGDDGTAVQITEQSYKLVADGNPDAWQTVDQ